jgi:hypothetical protein
MIENTQYTFVLNGMYPSLFHLLRTFSEGEVKLSLRENTEGELIDKEESKGHIMIKTLPKAKKYCLKTQCLLYKEKI